MQRGKNMDHDRERERGMRHGNGSGSGSECLPNSTLFLSTRDEIANDVSAAPVPNMEHFHFGWWNLVTSHSQADHRSDLTDTLLGVGSNFGNSNELYICCFAARKMKISWDSIVKQR